MKTIYKHYGATAFDKSKFNRIRNRPYWNKPFGGLWASPCNAKYGWKEWNDGENYFVCDDKNSFTFTLSENARILTVQNMLDFKNMKAKYQSPNLPGDIYDDFLITAFDFEKISKDFDAVYCEIGESKENNGLYDALYGWDCTSLLVLNPDVVCA